MEMSLLGERLCFRVRGLSSSESSALLSLLSDAEDVLRLLLFEDPRLSIDNRDLLLGLRLRLRDVLYLRLRGGVKLRLLLRVSRRSSRPLPL